MIEKRHKEAIAKDLTSFLQKTKAAIMQMPLHQLKDLHEAYKSAKAAESTGARRAQVTVSRQAEEDEEDWGDHEEEEDDEEGEEDEDGDEDAEDAEDEQEDQQVRQGNSRSSQAARQDASKRYRDQEQTVDPRLLNPDTMENELVRFSNWVGLIKADLSNLRRLKDRLPVVYRPKNNLGKATLRDFTHFVSIIEESPTLINKQSFTAGLQRLLDLYIVASMSNPDRVNDALQSLNAERMTPLEKAIQKAQKTTAPKNKGPRSKVCYNCHERGHLKPDCPHPKNGDGGKRTGDNKKPPSH